MAVVAAVLPTPGVAKMPELPSTLRNPTSGGLNGNHGRSTARKASDSGSLPNSASALRSVRRRVASLIGQRV